MDRASILIQSSQLNILVVIRGSHLVVELPLFIEGRLIINEVLENKLWSSILFTPNRGS